MSAPTDTPASGDLARLGEALDQLAAVPDWRLSDDELLNHLDQLGVIGDRVTGLRLRHLHTADLRRLDEDTATSLSDRITLTDRTSPQVSRRQLGTAKRLGHYPLLRTASEAGLMTARQVEVVVNALQNLPDHTTDEQWDTIQTDLIREAAIQPPDGLRRLAHHYLEVWFPDTADELLGRQVERDDRRARRDRHLAWERDDHGNLRIRGKLSRLAGEKFLTVISAFLPNRRGADLLLDPEAEFLTIGQRRADALEAVCDAVFATGTAPQTGGDRPQVAILLPYQDLVNGVRGATLLGSGEQITGADARTLACDADLIPVVLGTDSEVLDVGHKHRLFPSGIRRALTVRDQGCVFPGCDRPPSQCDAHHLVPWHVSRRTSVDNGALLCQHHHRLVEPDPRAPAGSRWTVDLDHRGLPHVRPPIRIDPERKPKQHARFHERAGP